LSTFISSGKDYQIKNFPVDGNPQEIVFNHPLKSFIMQAKDSTNLEFSRTSGGSRWTIKGGVPFSGDLLFDYKTDSASIGFIKTASGTSTLEVIGIF